MKTKLRIGVFALAAIVAVGTTLSFAQERQQLPERRTASPQPAPDGDVVFQMPVAGPEGGGPPGDFIFFARELSFNGKVVKGAPYSAEAVTESVQTLSDGNRIVNKTTAAVYRDSEGRTRREQTLKAIGSLATSGEPLQTVFINDPVTSTSYTLDPRNHIARKMPPMRFNFDFKVPGSTGVKVEGPESVLPPRMEPERIAIERAVGDGMAGGTVVWGWGNHTPKNESLGKQNVEGVEAEGTRSTVTIPAGEIGNERDIEIVNERWYSAELQTVVMTRHADPRFGESTYTLTNIDRSEPARSLFEVPSDYTLQTVPMMPGRGIGTGGGISASGGGGAVSYRSGAIGGINGGILNGKATSLPSPAYPEVAKAAHAGGTVVVDVTIDEEGNVVEAKAVSGHPLLQAASVTAARSAKFSPTKLSGQNVKVHGVLVYTFAAEAGQQTKQDQ